MKISPFKMICALAVASAYLASSPTGHAQDSASITTFPIERPLPASPPVTWPQEDLFGQPGVSDAPEFAEADDIKGIYFDGVPYEGKPTKVFAWIGVPKNAPGKLPGVVLVHGGGGTAYRDWVRLWMDRGYAAIAIDHCGTIPTATEGFGVARTPHPHNGGSQFSEGGFSDISRPLEDQWFYHAVASISRAMTVLQSQPEVDPKRVGLVGISWGGVLSLITAGVDSRFAFAVSVYGCGYLGENSSWLQSTMQITPPDLMTKWVQQWDPAQYGPSTRMPVLLCNGVNDFHFRPDSWTKTAAGLAGPVTLCLKISLPHSHPPEGDPQEVTAFADSIVKGGPPFATITGQEAGPATLQISFKSVTPIKSAELNYTTDGGDWTKRTWTAESLPLDASSGKVSAPIPAGATACYINLVDDRDIITSSVPQLP